MLWTGGTCPPWMGDQPWKGFDDRSRNDIPVHVGRLDRAAGGLAGLRTQAGRSREPVPGRGRSHHLTDCPGARGMATSVCTDTPVFGPSVSIRDPLSDTAPGNPPRLSDGSPTGSGVLAHAPVNGQAWLRTPVRSYGRLSFPSVDARRVSGGDRARAQARVIPQACTGPRAPSPSAFARTAHSVGSRGRR